MNTINTKSYRDTYPNAGTLLMLRNIRERVWGNMKLKELVSESNFSRQSSNTFLDDSHNFILYPY